MGLELLSTKNGTGDGTVLWLRTPRTEWNGIIILRLRTERNGMGQNGTRRNGARTEWLRKKEQEQNNLAEGPCSRTERNNFKKFGTMGCCCKIFPHQIIKNGIIYVLGIKIFQNLKQFIKNLRTKKSTKFLSGNLQL